jgi:hypothetical protein
MKPVVKPLASRRRALVARDIMALGDTRIDFGNAVAEKDESRGSSCCGGLKVIDIPHGALSIAAE